MQFLFFIFLFLDKVYKLPQTKESFFLSQVLQLWVSGCLLGKQDSGWSGDAPTPTPGEQRWLPRGRRTPLQWVAVLLGDFHTGSHFQWCRMEMTLLFWLGDLEAV